MKNYTTYIWKIVFYLYMILLIYFVIVKFNGLHERVLRITSDRSLGAYNYNIVPFRTISSYYGFLFDYFAYSNLLGNIITFVPLGFLFPIAIKKGISFIKTIGIGALFILGIEIIQYVFKFGYFDVDDIILNTIGCIIGRTVFTLFQIVFKRQVSNSPSPSIPNTTPPQKSSNKHS